MQNTTTNVEIYKYREAEKAFKILQDRKIIFAAPRAFNDPFDMNIEAAFPIDVESFSSLVNQEHFQFWCGEIDFSRFTDPQEIPRIKLLNDIFKNIPREMLEQRKMEFLSGNYDEETKNLRKNSEEILGMIRTFFQTWGIFCAAKRPNNLVMWSHYAAEHSGAVLGLTPLLKEDSILRLAKPVIYSEERPLVYRTAKGFIDDSYYKSSYNISMEVVDRLIHTKSYDWRYEEEYRVAACDYIPMGETIKTHKLYPEELTSLYLGCRMDMATRNLLITSAKKLNPSVSIYQMKMHKNEYALIENRL